MARTGWLICIGLLVWLAMPDRAAAAVMYGDQGAAYSACMAAAAGHPGMFNGRPVTTKCAHSDEWKQYTCYGSSANGSQIIGCMGKDPFYQYPRDKACFNRKDYNGAFPGGQYTPRNGSMSCDMGCETSWFRNKDGTVQGIASGKTCSGDDYDSDDKCNAANPGSYYNRQVGVCEPKESECPGGAKANSLGKCEPEPCPDGMAQQQDGTCKKKENECPAGEVRSPDGRCLPGDGQCASGEVRGPDGTCKKDSDGDGKPDDPGEKESFSGGDDCNVPPSCSGSPILCGQARIQWRIDCNTRKNRNIAGGSCAAMPVCTGDKCDAMEYAGLLMQWRTACATEKLASKGNDNGGDGSQPEWTKVGGMSMDPGAGASPDDTKVLTTKQIGVGDLDQSGIGGGGSCIGFASGSSSGAASGFLDVMASPPAYFCNYIAAIKALIILTASVVACFILSRGGA